MTVANGPLLQHRGKQRYGGVGKERREILEPKELYYEKPRIKKKKKNSVKFCDEQEQCREQNPFYFMSQIYVF